MIQIGFFVLTGNKFFKGDLFKVTASKSTAVQILDEALIPDEYKREVVTVRVDKTAIKKVLQSGDSVDGAVIDSSKLNVTFKKGFRCMWTDL